MTRVALYLFQTLCLVGFGWGFWNIGGMFSARLSAPYAKASAVAEYSAPPVRGGISAPLEEASSLSGKARAQSAGGGISAGYEHGQSAADGIALCGEVRARLRPSDYFSEDMECNE